VAVTSLLDNDLYQLTMSQYAWLHHRGRSVRFRFRNRTFSVPLAEAIDLGVLRERLDEVVATRFTPADVEMAGALGLLDEAFLAALPGFRLPAIELGERGGHLELTYEGPWHEAIFLETPVLAVVSQLHREQLGETLAEGERRLDAKVRYLAANPQLRFMEFGTRRRASGPWQRHVLERLVAEVPGSVLGTSNVLFAHELGLPALGTMAHQLFMVEAALALADGGDLGASEVQVVERWEALYPTLRTLLPDTYTTPFALAHVDHAAVWPMVRLDSGDPLAVGELVLDWWRRNGEDPRAHGLVFSDALDLRTMNVLHDTFADRTTVTFGWGTNLTNDLGFEALSLVIKPDAVDGLPCVKLSDNLAKATGPRDEIDRYRALIR
jgi:nicotinate phosphoribosyltransferase